MAALPGKAVLTRATTPLIYLVLTILWEAGVRLFHVPGWILPAPTAIIAIAKQWAPELLYNSYITVQ